LYDGIKVFRIGENAFDEAGVVVHFMVVVFVGVDGMYYFLARYSQPEPEEEPHEYG
jgi:hypothetical protein